MYSTRTYVCLQIEILSAIIIVIHIDLQWNPSIAATLGEQNFGRYIGGGPLLSAWLFCTQTVHLGPAWVPGRYTGVAFIQGWPLRIRIPYCKNESTTGADASVEALKIYHMKLTLAVAYLLC